MSMDRIIDLHIIIRLFQSFRHTLKFCRDLWKSQLNRGVLFGECPQGDSYLWYNRAFPSSPQSLFQSESKCETFVMMTSFN